MTLCYISQFFKLLITPILNYMKKIYLLITLFIVLFSIKSHSQSEKGKFLDNWSLNLNAGIPMFWGDVESTLSDKVKANTGWGFMLSKSISSSFALRGEFIGGSVSGSQPKYNRYFDADFYDYHINGTLNFINLIYGENPCRKLNVFGTLGIGFNQFRSLLKEINTDKIIAHSGYRSVVNGAGEEWVTESFIVGGIGFTYRLDSRFDLSLENQWHVMNTDYLDAKPGRFKYDILSYTSFGITYKFNFRKNPNTFIDCGKGGNLKGKLDDGSKKYYYNYETKQIDSSRYYYNNYENRRIDTSLYNGNPVYKYNIYNYNGGEVIINEGSKSSITKIDSLLRFNNAPQNDKILELENKIKELESQKNNVVPTNNAPVNSDKIKELENKIRELENQKNNVAPTNNTPVNNDKMNELENKIKELENRKNNVAPTNNNNDKINELENKIKELENQKNNKTPVNNVNTTNNITNVGPDNLSLLSVFFNFNNSVILPSEMQKIEIVAKLMSKDPAMKVVVTGHCDQKGTETYNERLSKRRANVVAKVLINKYKISKDRITKEYHGKKNPISQEHSINRRVDFIKQ